MAFSEVFDIFAPKVNAYFIQNGIKFESSEELTQEVLSTIWIKSNLYDAKKSALSTWIFTIARNKKIDFFRKNLRLKTNEEDVRQFLYDENNVNEGENEEILWKINKINKQLNSEQRKIIKMNFFENKSHKKIAEELEIPLGTVKSRIRASLNKMQKHIL